MEIARGLLLVVSLTLGGALVGGVLGHFGLLSGGSRASRTGDHR